MTETETEVDADKDAWRMFPFRIENGTIENPYVFPLSTVEFYKKYHAFRTEWDTPLEPIAYFLRGTEGIEKKPLFEQGFLKGVGVILVKKYSIDFLIDTSVRCPFVEELEKCEEWTGKEIPMHVIKTYFPLLREGLQCFKISKYEDPSVLRYLQADYKYRIFGGTQSKEPESITFLKDGVISLNYWAEQYYMEVDLGLFKYVEEESNPEKFEKLMSLYKRHQEMEDEVEEAYLAKHY